MMQRKMISMEFREFLLTGRIGRLELGLSREQVVDFLGEPPVSSEASAFLYPGLRVAFQKDVVSAFTVDPSATDSWIGWTGDMSLPHSTRPQIFEYLSKNGVAIEPVPDNSLVWPFAVANTVGGVTICELGYLDPAVERGDDIGYPGPTESRVETFVRC